MPESKKYVIFDSKESLLHSNIMDQNIYTSGGSNIYISKLVINKCKKLCQDSLLDKKHNEDISIKNVPSPVKNKTNEADLENNQLFANSSVQKRKFEEIQMDKNELQNDNFSPKFPKITDSSYVKEENFWEKYGSLKLCTVKNYTSLLPAKSLIPDLMDDSKIFHQINSLSILNSSNFCSSVHGNKSVSVLLVKKCFNFQTVEETSNIYDVQNLNWDSQFDSNSECSPPKENKLMIKCKKMTNATNGSIESVPYAQMHHEGNLSHKSLSFSKSTYAIRPLEYIGQGDTNANHAEIFTTASGKSINISNNALLVAQKFMQGMFQDKTQQEIDKDAFCSSFEKKQFIKVAGLKKNNFISNATQNHKYDKIITEKIDSSGINKNNEFGINYDTDSESFSTAVGTRINVSNAAMKAAHKLIKDVFENEDKIMPSTSGTYNTCKKKSAFKDIGCQPKKLLLEANDDSMDKALLEKFFDAVHFDEKESQGVIESSQNKDFDKVLESRVNNNLSTRKIRKSLGGRRSMKFYSHT